jgi:hypothetical protein
MASRNLTRGARLEHEQAQARLQEARDSRDAAEASRNAARASGDGDLEASVVLQAAEDRVAARTAWVRWVERDY